MAPGEGEERGEGQGVGTVLFAGQKYPRGHKEATCKKQKYPGGHIMHVPRRI